MVIQHIMDTSLVVSKKTFFLMRIIFQRTGSYSAVLTLVGKVYLVLLTLTSLDKKQVMTILWIGMITQGMSLLKVVTLRMQ